MRLNKFRYMLPENWQLFAYVLLPLAAPAARRTGRHTDCKTQYKGLKPLSALRNKTASKKPHKPASRAKPPKLQLRRRIGDLRKTIKTWQMANETIALVPTMGALHQGHLRLIKLAGKKGRRVVVSIFVNPAQFAPHEDLARYPRDEAGDLAKLAELNVDLVWAPSPEVIYPQGFATEVVPAGAALGLESEARPHFFRGVATVCTKLFTQVQPDVAIFGEKDYQQLQVIKQVVRDLDLPLRIIGAPTVREKDGLALSSRNKYLSSEEREIAPLLNQQIRLVAAKVANGGRIASATASAKKALKEAGFSVDYLEVRDAVSLASVKSFSGRPLRVLVAAWLGKTRLIDNCALR